MTSSIAVSVLDDRQGEGGRHSTILTLVSDMTCSSLAGRVRWAARPRRATSCTAHTARLAQRPLWRARVTSAWITAVALKESPVTRSGALRGAGIPRPKMGNGSRAGSTDQPFVSARRLRVPCSSADQDRPAAGRSPDVPRRCRQPGVRSHSHPKSQQLSQ